MSSKCFAPAGLTAPLEILGSQDSETGTSTPLCSSPPNHHTDARSNTRPQNLKRSPRGAHTKADLIIPNFDFHTLHIGHQSERVSLAILPNVLKFREDQPTHILRAPTRRGCADCDLGDVWIQAKQVALVGLAYRVLIQFSANTPLAGRRFLLVGYPGPRWIQHELF